MNGLDNLLKQFEKTFKDSQPSLIHSPIVKETGKRLTDKFLLEGFGESEVTGFNMVKNDGKLRLTPDAMKRSTWKFSEVFPEIIKKTRRDIYLQSMDFSKCKPKLKSELVDLQRFAATLLQLWGNFETFSSKLWIGNDTVTDTHYDESENVFMQLRGEKTFTLFPPTDLHALYCIPFWAEGGLCTQVDITNPDFKKYPSFKNAHPITFTVKPGDVFLIPPYWFHHVVSKDFSLSLASSQTGKNAPRGCTTFIDRMIIGRTLEGCIFDSWGRDISEPMFKAYSLGKPVDIRYSIVQLECLEFCKQFGVKTEEEIVKIMRFWCKDRF
jgi:hypothetical protein